MAERLPASGDALYSLPKVPAATASMLADVLVRQPQALGLDELTPFEVDAEVWRLSVLGWSPWRIRAALALTDVGDVHEALTRYMDTSTLSDTLKIAIMVGQLDDAIHQVMGVLHTTHYRFHKGELIRMTDEATGELEPVVDTGPTLDAAKTLAMLLERKAKLGGWDAPEKHEHTILPLPAAAATWVESKRLQAIEGTTA